MKNLFLTLGVIAFFSGCADADPVVVVEDATATNAMTEQPAKVGTMSSYPNPDAWEHANPRQKDRARRSFALLQNHKVPAYSGPLFVEDDDEVELQTAQDVARRTLVLWAVELRAEGIPQEESLQIITGQNLWSSVSPEEKRFLNEKNPDPDESQKLVWRLESIWVLLWALGHVEKLDWPGGMVDVPKLVEILGPYESDPKFITGAKLRSKAEILDQQDLTMRIHWAIRDALLNQGGMAPEALDWTKEVRTLPVTMHPAVGVVEQRHYVLNWLVRFLDPEDWDHVDTPT
jgi:hypothetical protein